MFIHTMTFNLKVKTFCSNNSPVAIGLDVMSYLFSACVVSCICLVYNFGSLVTISRRSCPMSHLRIYKYVSIDESLVPFFFERTCHGQGNFWRNVLETRLLQAMNQWCWLKSDPRHRLFCPDGPDSKSKM